MSLEVRRDLLVHERYLGLEANLDCMAWLDVLDDELCHMVIGKTYFASHFDRYPQLGKLRKPTEELDPEWRVSAQDHVNLMRFGLT